MAQTRVYHARHIFLFQVVGLLMINVSGPSVDVGRRLIEDRRSVKDFRELSKLFPLFEQPKDDTQPTEEVSDKN